jgi:integrase/recombinase XerC
MATTIHHNKNREVSVSSTGLEIQPYAGTLTARSSQWTDLEIGERRRRAVVAARDRDLETLWALTEARLATWGQAGARISPNSLRAYRVGVETALEAASGIGLLDPPRDWGANWVRVLEAQHTASTVRVYLSAARGLWAGLRWAEATEADPFADVRPARDAVPAWEKRQPYSSEDIEGVLEQANPRDRALVLLSAHGGLRVSEACALEGQDVSAGSIRVRRGKGGKPRTVAISTRLEAALEALTPRPGIGVLGLTAQGARAALRRLCTRSGVTYRGIHALRHSAGTRVYRETGDLENVARHLGHASLETARVYAKWSDERLKNTVRDW